MTYFLVMGAAGSVWWFIHPRLVPIIAPGYDPGALLSVAERLKAGDRLYSQVWDNKDPYFYYSLAMARACASTGSVILEHFWVALVGVAVWLASRTLEMSRPKALFAGFCLSPLVVTGSSYVAGMTHLPGVAVTMLALALALRGRPVFAGGALAVLFGLKLSMLPVAGVGVAVILFDGPHRTRELLRSGWAFAGGTVLMLVPLLLRGELPAYLRAQLANVRYAENPVLATQFGEPISHFSRVMPPDGRGSAMSTLLVVLMGLLLAQNSEMLAGQRRKVVWRACLGTVGAALFVSMRTGMWPHHGQVFEVPALLMLLMVCGGARGSHARLAVIGLLAALVLGGCATWRTYRRPVYPTSESMAQLTPRSPEARALLARGGSGRYARLGTHDASAHARGLDNWTLTCRHFAQYFFDPASSFAEQLECLHRVDFVVVDRSFKARDGQPQWNTFVSRADATLSRDFTCTRESFGRLCQRRR